MPPARRQSCLDAVFVQVRGMISDQGCRTRAHAGEPRCLLMQLYTCTYPRREICLDSGVWGGWCFWGWLPGCVVVGLGAAAVLVVPWRTLWVLVV